MASSLTGPPSSTQLEQDFWIKPATPVSAQIIPLPASDQVGVPIVVPRICCFTRDASLSEERLIEAVKVGTAGTIAEMPHLLGTITWADEASRRYQLEIPEDPQVLVKVRHHPEKSAADMARQRWAPHLFHREEMCLSKYPINGLNCYSFAVVVNLIQGGVVLSLHMHHQHMDGYAHALIELVFAHFLGLAIDGKPRTPSGYMSPSALDKSLVAGSHPARPILEWEDWREAPPPMKLDGFTPEQLMEMYVASMANFTLTIWRFSPAMQERIRREGQPPEGKKLSLASCLHSFLWQASVRARRHDPETPTLCLTPVQTRGRVKELPQHWSGSCLVYSRAKATVQEVLSVPKWELGRRIEQGVARWTPEMIREYWGSLEDCPDLSRIQPNTDRQNGTDVEFSNIANLPFYKINWGTGLNVAAWRCTNLAFTDAYTIVSPKLKNGDMEIFMYLNKDSLANLLEDPEWRERADYVASADPEIDGQVASTVPIPRAKL